ncbi:palmitoyltransferase ZDHHC4 isoform X2 [Psammomys obesus]|uniref:palmitoyltransferase ZDHHC4 isoform X2 n=1 Tax=Psammomys obesus TaxID=48139 RepID=UPI002452C3DB|nr:palmitoyltransferase ZDHHC4 isoform X2 [Psammomys obesus]
MDFLVLFLLYLAFLLIGVVTICIFTKNQRLKGLVLRGAQVCSCIIPQRLQRAGQRLLHQLFHTRNPTFIVLHLLLQALVYAEYTWEIFGYCQELEFSPPCLLLPYVLLSVNLVFFTLTCSSNPGTVTKTNESSLLQVYEFDDVMFLKNSRCSTCDLRKPARSKHCMALSGLCQGTYIDDLGHFQSMDTIFLIQYLFLAFPRIVFLLGFVMVLSLLLAGYLCFALYLAATNQTTNEWCRGDWAWSQHCPLVAWALSATPHVYQNVHSRGVWSNLREVFLPATPCPEKKRN